MKKCYIMLAIYLVVILTLVNPVGGYEITFNAQISPGMSFIIVTPTVPSNFREQIQFKFDKIQNDIENSFTTMIEIPHPNFKPFSAEIITPDIAPMFPQR